MMKTVLTFAAAVVLLASCGTTEKVKDTAGKVNEKVQEFPSADESEGLAIYGASCGRCHKLFEIKDFSQERWDEVLPPMIKKAKLDEEQGRKVTAYVNWKLKK